MELHVPIKAIVPIAHSSSANQSCLQEPGSKTGGKKAYWSYSFKCDTLEGFSAFQSLDSIDLGC